MSEIILLKGLPASGKTTWSRDLIDSEPGKWVRVNKDDIRSMLHNGKWSRAREKVTEMQQDSLVTSALLTDKSVIIDNTNLSPRWEPHFREMAKKYGATFTVHEMDTTVDECIKRDYERGKTGGAVGKDVILKMFYQSYCEPMRDDSGLPKAVIFDIDGTLAHSDGRSMYDWEKVGEDHVDEAVATLLDMYRDRGVNIIIMSGRDSACREITETWLSVNEISYEHLYMRKEKDDRKDTIVKKELWEEHVKGKYDVEAVYDDRRCMTRLWASLGLKVFSLGPDYEF